MAIITESAWGLDQWILAGISIGDPPIITGGNAVFLYAGLITGISASVFAWWYARRKNRAKRRAA